MTSFAIPAASEPTAALLRRLLDAQGPMREELLATSADSLAPAGKADVDLTLLGALSLGGTPFALQVAAARTAGLDAGACTEALLAAFFAAAEPVDATSVEATARRLVRGFGLRTPPEQLFDQLRADLLIHAGPLEEVAEAVLAAMRFERWDLAFVGLCRVRDALGEQTPANTYGMAAMCLHKMGRLEEADRWVRDGLDEHQQAQLRQAPVFSETELLQRWGGRDTPVVSIICTTYNHERYIESALQGFLNQDCELPFEILVHDDASTDATPTVIRRWQARYPRLIRAVLQTENQFSKGVRPFELLLSQARGRYVATCEGDDFWIDPGKLRRQVAFLEAHQDVSCTAHNYLHFMESSLTIRPWTQLGRDFYLSARQLKHIALVLWLPTLMFRKTFDRLPPERDHAAIGDAFLTSFLGTQGRCAYFETWHGAVRRENEFSFWSPLSMREKECRRVRTWAALTLLYARTGEREAVDDLLAKIKGSTLDEATRNALVDEVTLAIQPLLARA